MTRFLLCLASAAIMLAVLSSSAFAQADLIVQKTDISIVKNTSLNTTYVTVTVRNNGSLASAAFTLRIGASVAGASSTSDVAVAGLSAGQSTSKAATFPGLGWMCAWGNADVTGAVAETSEANNYASKNDYWIAILPGGIHEEYIAVVNPGPSEETVTLSTSAPPDWVAGVYPTVMNLGPGERLDAYVHLGAPSSFKDYACVEVHCNFADGTPGVMDWQFHMESAIPVHENTWGSIKALFGE
jgi:hypothetical protein